MEELANPSARPVPFEQAPPPLGLAQHPPVAGIVAEYNPFHNGHAWMVRQLRRGGVHTVVCVMGGPFVQRAEPAALPTHLRAAAAIAGGVDLVMRLPLPWAAASAEAFAQGGVGLLAALGCVDLLAFGSEAGDTEALHKVAIVLQSDAFKTFLKAELALGVSFAVARAAAAEKLLPGAAALLADPNNILGIEYLKALEGPVPAALKEKMDGQVRACVIEPLFGKSPKAESLFPLPLPLALPRHGAAHDGSPQSGVASASWLRAALHQHGADALSGFVPPACLPLYEKAVLEGALISPQRWQLGLLSRLKGLTAEDFAACPSAGEGLENRLAAAVREAVTLDEVYEKAKTKRFAHSRVRRLALAAALGTKGTPAVLPPFAQVLAANGRGLQLLKRIKATSLVPVSTSLKKLEATGKAVEEVAKQEAFAEDLHALWLHAPAPGGGAYTRPASMLLR